ncbi:unnamed protein product [Caenorhabditis nigoni]
MEIDHEETVPRSTKKSAKRARKILHLGDDAYTAEDITSQTIAQELDHSKRCLKETDRGPRCQPEAIKNCFYCGEDHMCRPKTPISTTTSEPKEEGCIFFEKHQRHHPRQEPRRKDGDTPVSSRNVLT